MSEKKILLTAFRGTSAEVLVADKEIQEQYMVLLMPSDKVKDSELLLESLQQQQFDFIISLGQCPNIKDKVHIETLARMGNLSVDTTFDCEKLKHSLEQTGLPAKLSDNAGTSFCNELYWNGLRYIEENKLDTRMVFVHIPFEKNIAELDVFKDRLFVAIAGILEEDTMRG